MISDEDLLETFELRDGLVIWKQIDLVKTHPTLRSRANSHNANKAGRPVQWWTHSNTGEVITIGSTRASRPRVERVLAMAEAGITKPKVEVTERQPRRGAESDAAAEQRKLEELEAKRLKYERMRAEGWEQLVTGEWIPPKGGTT